MAHRAVFLDGEVWTIRLVELPPKTAEMVARTTGAPTRWLSVLTDTEKRRIVPVPPDWESWSDDRFADAIRTAEVMASRQR